MRFSYLCALIFIFAVLIMSCGNKKSDPGVDFSANSGQASIMDTIISDLPDYNEIMNLLSEGSAHYNSELISPDKFVMAEESDLLSLQTGIIMADLAYCHYFNKVHNSMLLYEELEERSKTLNFPPGNIKKIAKKLESNLENRDKMIQLCSNEFDKLNEKLVKGQRTALAGLLIAGSLVESSRLMANDTLAENAVKQNVWDRQKKLLEEIKPLFDSYKSEKTKEMLSEIYSIHNSELNSKSGKRLNDLKSEIMN